MNTLIFFNHAEISIRSMRFGFLNTAAGLGRKRRKLFNFFSCIEKDQGLELLLVFLITVKWIPQSLSERHLSSVDSRCYLARETMSSRSTLTLVF